MNTPKQIRGCLPVGFDLDSMLTREEFCIWQQVGVDWFKARRSRLPGVISHSLKMVRVHPRTYLELSLKPRRL